MGFVSRLHLLDIITDEKYMVYLLNLGDPTFSKASDKNEIIESIVWKSEQKI